MITLEHVHHEINDEVSKNDKVHNSLIKVYFILFYNKKCFYWILFHIELCVYMGGAQWGYQGGQQWSSLHHKPFIQVTLGVAALEFVFWE